MQIDAVSQNPMWAAMSAGAMQPGSSTQFSSAAASKVGSDGDGDGSKGAAAVNDGDADDKAAAVQQSQSGSHIDIKV